MTTKITLCPSCQQTHASDMARAVGRFQPAGPSGYRAKSGGPLRATRGEAEADECHGRTRSGPDEDSARGVVRP